MMTERQRKFREQYVAQISPWYNGLVHVIVTFGVGIAAFGAGVVMRQVSRRAGAGTNWKEIGPRWSG